MKFNCTDINWDTDGQGKCGLPDSMELEIDDAYVEAIDEDDLEEELSDELSDKTGFCVLSFNYAKV